MAALWWWIWQFVFVVIAKEESFDSLLRPRPPSGDLRDSPTERIRDRDKGRRRQPWRWFWLADRFVHVMDGKKSKQEGDSFANGPTGQTRTTAKNHKQTSSVTWLEVRLVSVSIAMSFWSSFCFTLLCYCGWRLVRSAFLRILINNKFVYHSPPVRHSAEMTASISCLLFLLYFIESVAIVSDRNKVDRVLSPH